MPNILRAKGFLGVFILAFILAAATTQTKAQVCTGFPSILALGSSKNPNKLCSPVTANLTYNVTFASATPGAGTLQIEYNWDDGSAPEVFTLANGLTTYNHSRNHPFPANSDCEFNVVITLIYNGTRCASTRQVQKVASWRTDEFNGGNVQLISPTTGTLIHEVCRGEDISVVFTDDTQFNCNQNFVHAPGPLPVETPNTETRWQQIVYNTPIAGAKIPNLAVNGVPVTGAGGANIIGSYQDPRGVFVMLSPVLVSTAKRPTLVMTAPGGFTAGFPQVGDEFEITLRYWNFCNPYDDPNIPGPPGNLINGDNAPVERTSLIRIVAAPAAPTASTQAPVCFGTTPSAFSISGVPANNVVSWYRNVAGTPDTQGTLITSGVGLTSLPMTSHPNWVNNNTPGIYKVWATYRPNVAGALNCESPAVQVTRTIRERPSVPTPTTAPPAEICNGGSFPVVMPAPASTTIGGATQYTWTGSAGVSVSGTTANSATFNVNVTFAPGETFVDRTVTVGRRFTSSPSCSRSVTFDVRVFRPTVAGTPSASPDICETTPVGSISLSGHVGDILRWEVQVNGGGFNTYTGPASGNSITPGLLSDGIYQFQAVVQNENGGPCAIVTSGAETVTISDNPDAADAGFDQGICTLGPVPPTITSTPIGANTPSSGSGKWTVVATQPLGRPLPTFLPNDTDPNAQIRINSVDAGAYTLRWTVTSGVCTSFDDVIIDFGADPTDPIAGPSEATCGESYTLKANSPSIGFGKWTIVSGPGPCAGAGCPLTIANDEIATSQISLNGPAFVYGAYTLQWTVTSGGALCNVEQDQVTITFDEPATILTSPDVDAGCLDPSTLTPINLTGDFGGGAVNGHWEVVLGDGNMSNAAKVGANDAINPATDAYSPTLADYNSNNPIDLKFVASPAVGSSCPAVEDAVVITFDPKPIANAGTNIGNICGDQVSLDAESPAPFTAAGVWSSPDATLQFFSSVDQVTPDNTDPKAVVKNLKTGPNTVTWTLTYTNPATLATCVSDPASITLTRVAPPAPIDFDVFECEVSPAGGPVVANVTLTNYEDDVTGLTAAQRQITWFRNGPPPAGTLIANPSNPENNIVDGQIYSARIRELATSCISDAKVTVHVRPLAPAVNASAALCEDTPGSGTVSNIDLTQAFYRDKVTGGAAGVDVHWFQTLFDAQTNDPLTEITAPFDIAGNAQVVARITYSAPSATAPACPDFATLDLIINTIPTGAVINGDPTVCMGLNGENINDLPIYTYQVTSIPGATYVWNVPTGAGEFVQFGGGGVNDFFVILKFPFAVAPPVLDISVSVVQSSCASAPITLAIQREEIPGSPVVVGLDDVCQGLAGESYSIATPSPSSDYIWTITKQSDGTNGGAFIVAGQGQDEIFVDFTNEPVIITVKEQNAVCAGPDVNYPVAVNLFPTMQASNPSICSDSQTGITFTPDALSVPVDHYDILSVSTTAGINFVTPAGGPVAQNNVSANAIQGHVFENLQAVPLTVNYTVQPVSVNGKGLNCAGPAKIFIVNVLPEPQLDPNLSKAVCSEELSNILLLSASGTFPADGFIINSITVPAGVTPTDPNFLLVADGTPKLGTVMQGHAYLNTTSSNQVVAYSVSPFASTLNGPIGCTGNPPTTVNITVHPKTIVDQIVTTTPICNGDLIDVNFGATGNNDAGFIWSVKSFDPFLILNSAASGNGNIVDMNVTNQSQAASAFMEIGVRAKNTAVEETAVGCNNPEVLFQVEIRPSPEASNRLLIPACSDAPGGSVFTADLSSIEGQITPNAGTPGIRIEWFDGDPSDPASNQILAPALNAFAMQTNIVFVKVTNDNTVPACSKVVQASFDVKPNVGFTLSKTDVKCASESNGQIDVLVTTGNPQYLYSIKKLADPGYNAPVSSALTNFQFKFLEGDIDYMVKVESQSNPGCLMEQQIFVDQPDPLVVGIPFNPVLQEISCFGLADGQIQTTATGGTPPYQFTLSNTGQTNNTGTFINLSAGSYLVQVKDKNGAADGCPASASVTIDDPDPVIIRNMIAPVNALGFQLGCNNATDGQINFELETTGGLGNNQTGTENFTYILKKDNVDHPSSPIISTATLGTFPNLGAGNYQLVARDINSCESSPKFVVIVNPPPFDPGVIGNPMSACEGVKPADLFQIAPPFGGLGNFDFEWQISLDGITGWTAADPVGNNDKNKDFVFDAAGLVYDPSNPKFFYRRQVITAPGVSSCPTAFSNVIEVKVNPTPIAVASAVSPLCEGSSGGQASLTLVQGTYPVRYDFKIFDTDDPLNPTLQVFNNLGGDPATLSPATVFIPPSLTTTGDIFVRFTGVRDANGCAAADPADEPITVIPVNANFTLSDNDICSGESINVEWNRDNDLDYVLTFGDGEQRGFPFGNGDINPQTEAKVYVNNSTANTSTFQVTLKASYLAGTSIGCERTTFQNVTVQPTALVNLLPGETELCSGEFFEVRDRSLGVTGGQWMVAKGTDPAVPVNPPTPVPGDLSVQMFNTSVALADNPTPYTFTYEPTGGANCPVPTQSFSVNVYAMPTASFTASDATPDYIAGVAEVTFTNTSSPFDPSGVVQYEWEYGETGAAINQVDPATAEVDYFTKANKTVVLTATNLQNDRCETRFSMLIDVEVPSLAAAFTVTPRFACAPVTLVTVNNSPGADIFEWRLILPSGAIETSTLMNPQWTLTTPGVYTVRMSAGVIGDPARIEATPIVVEVVEAPFASFEIFLNQTVYIGTEVRLVNGTTGINDDTDFSWNFGDHPESENKMDFQPIYSYASEGNYDITLNVLQDYGPKDQDGDGVADGNVVCVSKAVRPITVKPGGSLKIPNAFTPNESNSEGGSPGDGSTNDFFLPIMDGVEEFTMQIFDRWGTLIFESREKNKGWNGYDRNGRIMPAGVYVYKIVLRLTDNSRTTKIGDVTLIR